jgi:hypothetical protein
MPPTGPWRRQDPSGSRPAAQDATADSSQGSSGRWTREAWNRWTQFLERYQQWNHQWWNRQPSSSQPPEASQPVPADVGANHTDARVADRGSLAPPETPASPETPGALSASPSPRAIRSGTPVADRAAAAPAALRSSGTEWGEAQGSASARPHAVSLRTPVVDHAATAPAQFRSGAQAAGSSKESASSIASVHSGLEPERQGEPAGRAPRYAGPPPAVPHDGSGLAGGDTKVIRHDTRGLSVSVKLTDKQRADWAARKKQSQEQLKERGPRAVRLAVPIRAGGPRGH